MDLIYNEETSIYEEYRETQVDWTKVCVDTPVLVSNNKKKWYNRYFAKYEDGRVFAWLNGSTSWSANSSAGKASKPCRSWTYVKLAGAD